MTDVENLLQNPSFEEGRSHWFSLNLPEKPYWQKFMLSDEKAYLGAKSVHLPLRSSGYKEKIRIVGAIQEVTSLQQIPKRLSGRYRIENWVQGTPKQYLQVVVSVTGASNWDTGLPVHTPVQLAYILSGLSTSPVQWRNRKFDFVENVPLVENEWIYFNKDLHKDFIKYWGVIPEQINKVRIFLEVRFDERSEHENDAYADVYYDDLYFGN